MTSSFRPGDRVIHRLDLATVLSVGTETWDRGSVRIQVDGDPLPIDTRECFLTRVDDAVRALNRGYRQASADPTAAFAADFPGILG